MTLALAQRQQQKTGLEFESYLANWASFIRGEQWYCLDLTQASVTMHIRSRGVTISDMVSNWGITPGVTENMWIQYNPQLDGEVHPLNIVGPTITTNKNACLQSNAAVEVTSANQNAENKQIAMRWQRVFDYFERTTWDESKRGFIFDSTQKEGTNLVEVFCKEIDKHVVPNISESSAGIAVYNCPQCGVGVSQVEEENEDDLTCPKCNAPVEGMVTPIEGLSMGGDDAPIYDIDDRIIPYFNFTIDTYGAKVGGLQTATWLQIQDLKNRVQMETDYPGRSFAGSARWSYSLQCAYALSRGRWQWLNSFPNEAWAEGHERFETREIYLHEDAYSNYRAPQDFDFVDGFGEQTFVIKQGQTIGEAQKAMYGEDQHGFKFIWTDDTLLTIPSPKREELNFRDRFSDAHFNRESGAYLSSPNYSLVYIQDDITLLNTLNHNIIARNAVNPIFFDSLAFEQGDFSKEFIGSKDRAFDPDFDIRKSVVSLPIPTPSPYLAQQMQWLWSIKDSVSLVTPAMRGESQSGQPYAAQRQQLEQSFGNLTAMLKSFANCKVVTGTNKAKIAKKRWTLEQFQRVGSMFGEIWTEEDIEEMCGIDFDRDLIISYREGSEMPSTPISKELKFFGALQQLATLPPELAMQVITPDKWQKIVEKLGEAGDFEFDLASTETDEMVSQKRYIALAELCIPYQGITFDQIEAMRAEIVSVKPPTEEAMAEAAQISESAPDDPQAQAAAQQMLQPTPITKFDTVTEQIFHEAGIRFSKYEDLEQATTFFIEQVRAEQGKGEPNEMLIAQLEVLLGMLEMRLEQIASEAPPSPEEAAMAAQQELEASKLQLEADNNKAKLELEATKAASAEATEKERLELEREKVEIQATDSERKDILAMSKADDDREHQKELADKAAKSKPKEKK